MISLALLIIAVVLSLLAAVSAPQRTPIVWGWLAFFFYLLFVLIGRAGVH